MPGSDEILLVHMGGLGDVCLAESAFLSLREHFGDCLRALGNRRFLDLFAEHFAALSGIESRHWLYLFSEELDGPRFTRIVFIGKDRQGSIRRRWKTYSNDELIFIDMYPDGAFPDGPREAAQASSDATHIEDFQLRQIADLGIRPLRAPVRPAISRRVILYPEKGFAKDKWPLEGFLDVADMLRSRDMDVVILKPPGLNLPDSAGAVTYEDLHDVKEFFSGGGTFVSNDSGMAHLAGALGLLTITIFSDFDPAIWHPRGRNVAVRRSAGVDAALLSGIIMDRTL